MKVKQTFYFKCWVSFRTLKKGCNKDIIKIGTNNNDDQILFSSNLIKKDSIG